MLFIKYWMVGSPIAWKQACIIYDTTVLKGCTILNQCFLFIGAFMHSDIIIWHGKYGKNASSILFTSVQSPVCIKSSVNMDDFTPTAINLANLCTIQSTIYNTANGI